MKQFPIAALAAAISFAACSSGQAQTSNDILQRLEALEKSNTKLQESNAALKDENAALRDRVKKIEASSQGAYAAMPKAAAIPAKRPAGYAASEPVYKAMPMAVPAAFNWTGFYIGGHGGYASGRMTGQDLRVDEQGAFGGVQMGVNYQFSDHWMLGFEQDASIANIGGTTAICAVQSNNCGTVGTIDFKLDSFGSFRERVGYVWDRVLFYETAGIAWANAGPHINVAVCSPGDQSCQVGPFNDRRLMTGFAAGAGIEVAATSNLTIKAEYLYLDFPNKNFLAGTTQKGSADVYAHTVNIGANWLFH